jgi:hypothetical protein
MKRIPLLIALVLTFSFGLANAQSFDVDNMVGTWTDGSNTYLNVNTPIVYNLRLNNSQAVTVKGLTNGWRVYSPDAATWTPLVLTDLIGMGTYFDLVNQIGYNGNDGAGADTAWIGHSVMTKPGLPAGFNAITHSIATQVVEQPGKHLCIDSSYYPPSGLWLWANGGTPPTSVQPAWGGPYCYEILRLPNARPEITPASCPDVAYTGSHCTVVTHDFDATDAEQDDFTFAVVGGVGTIHLTTGAWSYAPSLADVGASLFTEVAASDAGGQGPACHWDLMFTNIGPHFTGGCGATYFSGADMATTVAVTAVDGDCDPVTITFTGVTPAPVGTVVGTGASVVFTPNIADTGTVFTFAFSASDGDLAATCEAYVDVKGETNFAIVIEKEHGTDYYPYGVIQGQHAFVDVTMTAGSEIPAGFDILIAYDASALVFQTATPGPEFYAGGCGWEYFNYRFGANGNCGNACPSGVLRVVGIAETNNGPNHPTCLKPSLPAVMFTLDFLVTNDRTFECMFVPIRFFWMDCGDNSLAYFPLTAQDSVVQGIEASVWNYYGGIGEETVYHVVTAEPTGFPTYFGAPDACMNPITGKPDPKRIIDFYNGGIDIICAGDIDDRGDINLNGEMNEIADAVLFSNYFVEGLQVFLVNVDGQVAATDVNADGLTLSVADLVYLIRVIIGDALPYAKLSTVAVNYTIDGGVITVDRELGAAFVMVSGNVTPTLLAENMELKYGFDGQNTRILVSSLQGNAFSGEFLAVTGEVISIEMATPDGAMALGTLMPTSYELAQNYPNPFNPTTTIGFSMKTAGEYTLTIYNVTGQTVATFSGQAVAGNHSIEWNASSEASGIYFYKLSTDNFTDTKKMVLLK